MAQSSSQPGGAWNPRTAGDENDAKIHVLDQVGEILVVLYHIGIKQNHPRADFAGDRMGVSNQASCQSLQGDLTALQLRPAPLDRGEIRRRFQGCPDHPDCPDRSWYPCRSKRTAFRPGWSRPVGIGSLIRSGGLVLRGDIAVQVVDDATVDRDGRADLTVLDLGEKRKSRTLARHLDHVEAEQRSLRRHFGEFEGGVPTLASG